MVRTTSFFSHPSEPGSPDRSLIMVKHMQAEIKKHSMSIPKRYRNSSACSNTFEKLYRAFIIKLAERPEWILELIHEVRSDVILVWFGTYTRWVITGPAPAECILESIQRIAVCTADGTRLYTKALLPGLLVPYRQYSLQFILNCLVCFYSRHEKICDICSRAKIDQRLFYEWVRLADQDHLGEILLDWGEKGEFEEPIPVAVFPFLSILLEYRVCLLHLYFCLNTRRHGEWEYMF